MKSDATKNYQMLKSSQIAEHQLKELKSLLIKLPISIAIFSMIALFLIGIGFNPVIRNLMINNFHSLASYVPISGKVWLTLSTMIGVLVLTRRKQKIFSTKTVV